MSECPLQIVGYKIYCLELLNESRKLEIETTEIKRGKNFHVF